MRLVTYKCDRCRHNIESHRQVMRLTIEDIDYGVLADLELCPECTDRIGVFLGLNQEGVDSDDGE